MGGELPRRDEPRRARESQQPKKEQNRTKAREFGGKEKENVRLFQIVSISITTKERGEEKKKERSQPPVIKRSAKPEKRPEKKEYGKMKEG